MKRAIFTLSLDFELAWGTLDRNSDSFYRPIYRREREQAIARLLDLFERYGICATWATVGAMFERGSDDLLHAPDLIEEILSCRVKQEIGSHTFDHPVMTKVSRDEARRQFERSIAASARLGVRPTSIIFPRNQIAHLDIAREYGFTCYRSPEPRWYCHEGERGAAKRLGHLADVLTASTPASGVASLDGNGMVAIPGSMLFTPSFGVRRYIPVSLRVKRADRGPGRSSTCGSTRQTSWRAWRRCSRGSSGSCSASTSAAARVCWKSARCRGSPRVGWRRRRLRMRRCGLGPTLSLKPTSGSCGRAVRRAASRPRRRARVPQCDRRGSRRRALGAPGLRPPRSAPWTSSSRTPRHR